MSSKLSTGLLFITLVIFSCKKEHPTPKTTTSISGFTITNKYIGDPTFAIPQPTSNSNGTFTYTSNNANVAGIKGDSIQINSTGTVTITATQAATATNTGATLTTTFQVLPSIYITGWNYGPAGDQPLYWRNGVAVNLQGQGTTNGIFIQGNDVYISGGIQSGDYGYGGYWKNGVPHLIQKDAIVNGIAVSGNDVYAVGYIQTNDASQHITATLWKNDVAIPLTNPLSCCGVVSSSNAFSVTISNNTIYIAGTSFDPSNTGAATLWKADATAMELTNPDAPTGTQTVSAGYGITAQGNDVYIAGTLGPPNSPDHLGYWKNGAFMASQTTLPPYPNNLAIAINGADVYTAGIHAENGLQAAAYWKNGAETILAPNGTARGIALSGNDVYVVGTTLTEDGFTWYPTAVYWLNGVLVNLPSALVNNSTASAVWVRNK